MSSLQPKQILVPCDLSDKSIIALSQTFNLARFSKAEITLLYVIEEDGFASKLFFSGRSKQEETMLRLKVKEELDKIAAETFTKQQIKVNTLIKTGSKIYDTILEASEEIDALFIVMAKNTREGINKIIGSNTLKVVSEAKCPVITLKGTKFSDGCKKIVLPLDLSKETKEKVSKAIEIARNFGSEIYIATVQDTTDTFLVNKLKRQIQMVSDFIAERGVTNHSEIINAGGDPSEAVCEYADKIEADLIVIMTQEELNWNEFLVGSAAQKIINGTNVPVLSIKPTEKANMSTFSPY